MFLLITSASSGQVKFPEYLEHYDDTKALVDQEQVRGHHWSVIDKTARNAIPENKREIGMLVTWIESGAYTTKRFQGANVTNTEWTDDLNWSQIVVFYEGNSIEISNDSIKLNYSINVDTITSPNDSIALAFLETGDDKGISIVGGQFAVGSYLKGFESVFGEGDSHTEGMIVLTTSNGTTFTDVTTAAKTSTGSTFAPFGGGSPGIGAAFYVGSDDSIIGLKIKQSFLVVPGTGTVAREYYNGATWSPFMIMATNADAPYESRADNIGTQIGSEQVRFGNTYGQVQTTVNGQLKYWVRFRVTSALSSDGLIEQVKLHTNRLEINADGFTEYFGAGIYPKELVVHLRTASQIEGFAPKDEAIDYTSEFSLVQTNNKMENSVIDGFGGLITIPEGMDTSKDLVFEVSYVVLGAGAGQLDLEVQSAQMQVGDLVDGTHPVTQTINNFVTIPINNNNIIKRVSFSIDVEELLPGEFAAYTFKRDATPGNLNDTYVGDVAVLSIRAYGYFWKP